MQLEDAISMRQRLHGTAEIQRDKRVLKKRRKKTRAKKRKRDNKKGTRAERGKSNTADQEARYRENFL